MAIAVIGYKQVEKIRNKGLSLEVVQVKNGYGYQIFKGKKLYINQEQIPAIDHRETFKTEDDAEKVGNLILQKLEKGQSPTVTAKQVNQVLTSK